MGEVSVMITLSDDGTRIVDKDTKETSESIEKTTVIYDDEDTSVPYVTSTDKPTVSGVLVVAQGGGNPTGKTTIFLMRFLHYLMCPCIK